MRFATRLHRVGASFGAPLRGISVLVLACAAPACESARTPTAPSTVSLRLRGSPPNAAVVIDDEAIGTLDFVAAHGVALPPGVHHVTVEARGFFPWDHEVDAAEGAPPIVLDVTLVAVPD